MLTFALPFREMIFYVNVNHQKAGVKNIIEIKFAQVLV